MNNGEGKERKIGGGSGTCRKSKAIDSRGYKVGEEESVGEQLSTRGLVMVYNLRGYLQRSLGRNSC